MRAQSFPLTTRVNVPRSHWDGALAVDLFAPRDTPWAAVFDGVAQPIDVPLGGYALLLRAADGWTAYYAHGLPDRASGPVVAGQTIGYVSDSGNARGTGHHLHFAVGRSIDDNGAGDVAPWEWLAGTGGQGEGETGGYAVGERDWSNLAKGILLLAGAYVILDIIGG